MEVRGLMVIWSVVFLFRSFSAANYYPTVKYLVPGYGPEYDALVADATKLRQVIFDHLIQDEHSIMELRSALLRLGFHDCVGGCDGCVDMANPDNNRLDEALEITKQWHSSTEAGGLSRADVNALAAAVTATIAINHGKATTVHIPFFPGRTDCPDRDNMPARVFPSPFSPTAFKDLLRFFGLTVKEAVGLLGAHSIGELEIQSSGYGHFPWDEDEFSLDNEYYKELLEVDDWKLERVSNSIRDSSQWEDLSCTTCSHQGIMMLHTDVGLIRDFTVSGQFHEPSCQLAECPGRSSTLQFVKKFAANNDAFISTFVKAFKKMITTLPDGVQQRYPPQRYPPQRSSPQRYPRRRYPSTHQRRPPTAPKPRRTSKRRDRNHRNRVPPSHRRNRNRQPVSRRPAAIPNRSRPHSFIQNRFGNRNPPSSSRNLRRRRRPSYNINRFFSG